MNNYWKKGGTICAVVWLSAIALMIILQSTIGEELYSDNWQPFWNIFAVVNAVSLFAAILCYIKSKGRSAFWLSLVIFLPVIGLIVILLLKNKNTQNEAGVVAT
jgi:predicted membrane channel-forming protein YqfA (hemolysin III family)